MSEIQQSAETIERLAELFYMAGEKRARHVFCDDPYFIQTTWQTLEESQRECVRAGIRAVMADIGPKISTAIDAAFEHVREILERKS